MKQITILFTAFLLLLSACQKDSFKKVDSRYNPDINPSKFTNSTDVTNPYYPLTVGKTHIYEGQTKDVLERVEEKRLAVTKFILAIECVVVNFRAYENGKLIEEAFDWYAQDNDGNLWYFGEAVDNYNSDGSLNDHEGSWEAGVDGAKPGMIMPAYPKNGMKYREEYYFNHAEDEAQIIATGLTVTIPLDTYSKCVKIRNWTRLEPGVIENKFYAPGVGLIKEIDADNTEIRLITIQ